MSKQQRLTLEKMLFQQIMTTFAWSVHPHDGYRLSCGCRGAYTEPLGILASRITGTVFPLGTTGWIYKHEFGSLTNLDLILTNFTITQGQNEKYILILPMDKGLPLLGNNIPLKFILMRGPLGVRLATTRLYLQFDFDARLKIPRMSRMLRQLAWQQELLFSLLPKEIVCNIRAYLRAMVDSYGFPF